MKIKLSLKTVDKSTLDLTVGKYWVGDPCYVFPKSHWDKYCDVSFDSNVLSENGVEFFQCGTAFGDGCYQLTQGGREIGECGVDAGLLAVIPESLLRRWGSRKKYNGVWDNCGGVTVEVKTPCTVKSNGGNITFGEFEIITGD